MSDTNLYICGNSYKFYSKLTLSTLKVIIGDMSEEKEISYRYRIAAAIKKSLIIDKVSAPSLEQIVACDDSIFKKYIDTVVSMNINLLMFYKNRDEQEDQCVRFCKACENYFHSVTRELAESISERLKDVTPSLAELTQRITLVFSSLQQQMADLSSVIAPALNYITTIGDNLSQNLKDFSKKIDWNVWQKNYELWGYYGWAVIGHAPFYFYSHPPKNQIDSDRKALKYFKKDDLITLWSDLKSFPFSSQQRTDINEAISCFEAKNYKACSMLVCALMDGVCIKKQSRDGKLNVGVGAVSKINNKFKNSPYGSSMGLIFLYYRNLFQCLFTFFERTDNFKKEPPRYNRNFVNHGMSTRKILKKDCIKLFLVLHNLMELTEWCNIENYQ